MSSTTNFEEWLEDGNEPEGYEEVYALACAARGEEGGMYDVSTNSSGHLFIKGVGGNTLALVSEKAKTAFNKHILGYKEDPEMDWDSWCGFWRAMSKDD